MTIDIDKFKKSLGELLQDDDETRALDSLESVLIRTAIRAQSVDISDSDGQNIETLGGWLKWLQACSQDG